MTHLIITDSPDWTFETIEKYEREIARIAAASRLDIYPNQLEIISSEQMIDAYSLVGLPVGYTHWSFGKQFLSTEQNYRKGHMGLAYEIVINSDPCISYLMEENTATMQALVIAHAAFGHNSFFKGNYLFRSWTKADAIIDYLVFARDYVAQCESRHGELEVELLLDSCHALINYGVDTCRQPHCRTADEERARVLARLRYQEENFNDLWRTVPQETFDEGHPPEFVFPTDPQENILYFIEKNAPHMEPWKREIVRIVRKIAQYFHPQRQTKVMNEGWASFWHYTLINTLYDEGFLSNGQMMEFLQSHTNVIFQPGFDDPRYSGINPYALGFAMMSNIRRICENRTDEDRSWFPSLANTDWLTSLDFAMGNFKDESFITQYLSPNLIRRFKLFSILDDDLEDHVAISAIHDEYGYLNIRNKLAEQYNIASVQPDIKVVGGQPTR
ncbi:MAG: stage V sporulation protein R [Gammaproteobacteria bacterium]|jgi:stage V sporulation protein R